MKAAVERYTAPSHRGSHFARSTLLRRTSRPPTLPACSASTMRAEAKFYVKKWRGCSRLYVGQGGRVPRLQSTNYMSVGDAITEGTAVTTALFRLLYSERYPIPAANMRAGPVISWCNGRHADAPLVAAHFCHHLIAASAIGGLLSDSAAPSSSQRKHRAARPARRVPEAPCCLQPGR